MRASLLLVVPLASCFSGGSSSTDGTFAEPRRYRDDSPPSSPPGSDFEIEFCPDGAIDRYLPGGDAFYVGTYEIADEVVTVQIEGISTPVFTLEDGGDTLVSDRVVLDRVDVSPGSCSR